jgi:biotin carboxylase
MNVVMISPGFPLEMAYFTRAPAETGATVIGVGDQPVHALPPEAQSALAHYEHVSLANEAAVLAALRGLAQHVRFDQVECLWEPYMVLAAQVREAFDLPGMTVGQTLPFRDKELMKTVLDEAGIRTPRHASTSTVQGIYEAAENIGYPLIIKPIAGAGSADTYRIDSLAELTEIVPMVRHVDVVSVEEFIEAEEFTYDTVCGAGEIVYDNISWYRPRPLEARSHEWISPMTVVLRDIDADDLRGGRQMGHDVLRALGFTAGFTHMEWYRKADGEIVFGEIGARPPGARTVDVMNYAADGDLFRAWAEAVLTGRCAPLERRYNAASIFKRAEGSGHISRVDGLERILHDYGDHIVVLDLLPIGAHRRDWRATLLSDGMIIVRHPDLDTLINMGDRMSRDLRMYAS